MSKPLSIIGLILGLAAVTLWAAILTGSILTVGIDEATVTSGLVLVAAWLLWVKICPKA